MSTRSLHSACLLLFGGAIVLAYGAQSRAAVDFVRQVQPILETNCVSCHHGDKAENGFDLSTRDLAFHSGSEPPALVPFKPDQSPIYKLLVVSKDDSTLMPPAKQGGPLDKPSIEILRLWIAE